MMPPVASTTASSAGQTRDDDVEQADDGTDYGLEDCANAVYYGHQAGTDGAEYSFNLWFCISKCSRGVFEGRP